METRLTDRVRKVVAMAREEALRYRHAYVGPEHLLLGLMRDTDPEVTAILKWNGTGRSELRDAVLEHIRPGKAEVEATKLPYTARAKAVLELAGRAAERRASPGHETGAAAPGSPAVGAVELLAGLLGEGRTPASRVLRETGITADALLGGGGEAGDGPEVVLDDASDRSIYEQIVEQIQEHIAVGNVRPGKRLPTVRRLADRLDIAPGTVSRAYGELERLGLVVTGGARGTRVAERERSTVSGDQRAETLAGLLRPVVVAAFHLGGTADELRGALDRAMADIFNGGAGPDA